MGEIETTCYSNAVWGLDRSLINHSHSNPSCCSVINTFKSMVVDDDVLEKEDMYILNRMKEFISSEEVVKFAAAKQLLILIERAVRIKYTYTSSY